MTDTTASQSTEVEGTGAPETRLNIDVFSTRPEYKIRWNLFLRALAVVQSAPPDDPMGYFCIAGIHGWPLVTWPDLKPGRAVLHYCPHGKARFPTWHRPYLYLLEQSIVNAALTLALGAPMGLVKQYTDEAQKIRIPFWDWATVAALPNAATNPDTVISSEGLPTSKIKNPLYSYKFPSSTSPPVVKGHETTRFPDSTIKSKLEKEGLRARVYHALTTNTTYAPFSNCFFPGKFDSIESPHNLVHFAISDIMTQVLVTAFDPIFWLFHSVMDYYYALWQTVHPLVVYSDNYPDVDTIDYKLQPFQRARQAGAWTSRMVQRSSTHDPNTWVFGVQYPETLLSMKPEERLSASWRAILRYAPTVEHTKLYPPGAVPKDSKRGLPDYPDDLPDLAMIRREWRVVIKCKNNLIAGNFTILVFLNESERELDLHQAVEATVGTFGTFKAPLESCENCQDNEGKFMYGSIYLTDKLLEQQTLTSPLDNRDALESWLTKNLDWKMREAHGPEFSLQDTDSLYVGVESFYEAYVPVDDAGIPIECDYGKIAGQTFNHTMHPVITSHRRNKGGQI